jgi:ABC-type glutathione transport system ATPase component
MNGGVVVESGPVRELFAAAQHEYHPQAARLATRPPPTTVRPALSGRQRMSQPRPEALLRLHQIRKESPRRYGLGRRGRGDGADVLVAVRDVSLDVARG